MVAKPTKKRATYQDIIDAPENMVAEILDGELFLASRPKSRHARNATVLGGFLVGSFEFGLYGPGGWKFAGEPELHLGPESDRDIVVPDIAGWRADRFADDPDGYSTVVPDWVCEVRSPTTARIDRLKKMPIYECEKVVHVWRPDPSTRLVEVFRLAKGRLELAATHDGNEPTRLDPFGKVPIPPAFFWGS